MLNTPQRMFKSEKWRAFAERDLPFAGLRDPEQAEVAIELTKELSRPTRTCDLRLPSLAVGLSAVSGMSAIAQSMDTGVAAQASAAMLPPAAYFGAASRVLAVVRRLFNAGLLPGFGLRAALVWSEHLSRQGMRSWRQRRARRVG